MIHRQRITPDHLPKLLITAHSSEEHQQALEAAQQLQKFVDSASVITESSRNKTAVNALTLHRANWPEMSEQERKSRILLLSRRGGGGKPQFIAPFVGGSGTTCGTWTPIVAYQRGKTTWIAGTRSKEEERQATPLLEYCLRPAAALRQTVRDQLVMMDPEYKRLTIDVALLGD